MADDHGKVAELGDEPRGRVFDIQRWSLHDGPGIRTTVFLKGCSLRCKWCANPESVEAKPEMAWFQDECVGAGQCALTCPFGAIEMTSDGPRTDWNICRSKCYSMKVEEYPCTTKCPSRARRTVGKHMTVKEILEVVEKDRNLYRKSGGGITVSGGEPLYQSRFLKRLLREAKSRWLNTAIESCGFANPQAYEEVLPFVDLLFLDIKHINDLKHKEATGQGNVLILRNVRRIAEIMHQRNKPLVIRTPVVPGHTMNAENISAIAQYVRELPGVSVYELMPYHRLGSGKYASIGKPYLLGDVKPPAKEEMQQLVSIVTDYGLLPKWN